MLAFPKLSGLLLGDALREDIPRREAEPRLEQQDDPEGEAEQPRDESDPADHDPAADLGWEAVHQPLALPPGRPGTQRRLATLDRGHSSHAGVPDVRHTTQEEPNHGRDPLQRAHESIVVPA